jgi:predicted AlkP superfamily phosphohydrolase/phosphomutase
LKFLPLRAQQHLIKKRAGMANALLSQTQMGAIDWGRTRAFSTEMNTFPAIWINLRGREPEGIVAPGREYERVRQELIEAAARFSNPHTGRPVVARAHRREELYHGPHLDQAPDLVLELELDEGYTYTCLSSAGRLTCGPIRTLTGGERTGAKGQSMNGSHRRQGIFGFSKGPEIEGRSLGSLSIMDMAPTILQFLNLPVPADMDGRVIPEIAPGVSPSSDSPRRKGNSGPRVPNATTSLSS